MRRTNYIFILLGLLGAAGVSVALGVGGSSPVFAQQQVTTPNPTVVALGDSLTEGVGASAGQGWVDVVSRWSQIDIVNAGNSGDTTEEALARLESSVLSRNPDIVIVFLGGNDVLQRVPREETKEDLTTIVERIKASGAEVILVATHGDLYQFEIESVVSQVASEQDTYYVSNALQGILGRQEYLSDAVHPNDRGYRLVSERIWDELQEALNDLYPTAALSVYCEADVRETYVYNDITWRAYVWGQAQESYRYEWQGEDIAQGSGGRDVRVSYGAEGTKDASVTVYAGDVSESRDCSEVRIIAPPLVGACMVDVSIDQEDSGNIAEVEWKAEAAGGTGEYAFEWSLSDMGTTTDVTSIPTSFDKITAHYTTTGTKEATVTITSGNQSRELSCSAVLRGYLFNTATGTDGISNDFPLVGSCDVNPDDFSTQDEVSWSAYGYYGSDSNLYTYTWSGTDLSGNEQYIRKRYDEPGLKEGTVTINAQGDELTLTCATYLVEQPVEFKGRKGCFIATAAHGSEAHHDVWLLRRFRDKVLMESALGRGFVALYYQVSPPIAEWISSSDTLRAMARTSLTPLVWLAQKTTY